jgi:hypothetical protein
MPIEVSDDRPHSRRGLSRPAQRALWGALGGGFGLLAGVESGLALGGAEAPVGLVAGAAVGALLAPQLNHALPAFGIVVGPMVTLTLMNLQRFTAAYSVALPPLERRRAVDQQPTFSLPHVSAAIGVIASALLAAVLLYALGRKIRGERRPLLASFRSLAWICFWITLVMILISNFAPI